MRPTHKELTNKIRKAIKAVIEGRVGILDPVSLAAHALELGYQINDFASVLIDALQEVCPDNYIGYHPPQKSYEERIKNCELFVFNPFSRVLGCTIYLKFVIKEDFVWIVSLHDYRGKGKNQ